MTRVPWPDIARAFLSLVAMLAACVAVLLFATGCATARLNPDRPGVTWHTR